MQQHGHQRYTCGEHERLQNLLKSVNYDRPLFSLKPITLCILSGQQYSSSKFSFVFHHLWWPVNRKLLPPILPDCLTSFPFRLILFEPWPWSPLPWLWWILDSFCKGGMNIIMASIFILWFNESSAVRIPLVVDVESFSAIPRTPNLSIWRSAMFSSISGRISVNALLLVSIILSDSLIKNLRVQWGSPCTCFLIKYHACNAPRAIRINRYRNYRLGEI